MAGIQVTKANVYSVLSPPLGVNVSKVVVYAVLDTPNVRAPSWPSFSFAGGVLNAPYSQDFDLAPAASPTTYTTVSGSLPTGLSLSDVAADVGRLSGTPTALGTFTFTLRASNTYGTADQAFSITVSVAPIGTAGNFGYVA